jgi:NAD(P)-dependent dehydrogenase (short-subunit alcohol dehydrogenase family)
MRGASRRPQLDRLDVLVNNAGVWSSDRRESPDEIELTWATNVIGPCLLRHGLDELARICERMTSKTEAA